MTYRTILAYADAEPAATIRFQIAAALAARSDATLDGVFVKPLFVPPPSFDAGAYVPPTTLEVLAESHRALVAKAEETAQTNFAAAADQARARAEWAAIEDGAPRGFIGLARCSDLVVFPKSGTSVPPLSPMELARESAAPLVLVPTSPNSTRPGRKVLLAWNGSREAASALRGAWPIIEEADRVHVMMVEPPAEAEAFIGKRLKRHGVTAQMHINRSADAQAGEIIRNKAEELSVDLVVMGLYGHSRLRELILGGASRTMLDQETLTLLVSR
jgi:nucleotide-binding universal stress UspA family protein